MAIKKRKLKGIFSDSNDILLWHESEDINKKSLFPKFQLIQILRFQVMHDYVCFIAPIDYCVELSLMFETFCESCSHFRLKWFQPNSFGEVCFWEKMSYENMKKKNKFGEFWEWPLFDIREHAFIQEKRKPAYMRNSLISELHVCRHWSYYFLKC